MRWWLAVPVILLMLAFGWVFGPVFWPDVPERPPLEVVKVKAVQRSEPADLNEVLARLDAWYAQYVPAIHRTLRPGVSEADLNAFERKYRVSLPSAFRTLYRWHDGQNWSAGGVLGLDFQPLSSVISERKMWADIAERDSSMNVEMYIVSHPTGAIREVYASADWLPFLSDGGGNAVSIDLFPDVTGKTGQVITTGRDEMDRYVLAPDLESFLREYLRRLEAAQVTVKRLAGYSTEMWEVKLHKLPGQPAAGYLAGLFPSFGAALDFGPDHDEPISLAQGLKRLDTWLHAHQPDLWAQLPPGATEAQLRQAQDRMGRPLPPEVVMLYRQHARWGEVFGLPSIPISQLGAQDRTHFGPPDAAGKVMPFSAYQDVTSARDWLPLWQASDQAYLGVNLGRYNEVLTFGTDAQPRMVLAEDLTTVIDRYVRFLEAGLVRREGQRLILPDAAGKYTVHGINEVLPGYGVTPALRP